MKTILFSAKPYDRHFFDVANQLFHHALHFTEPRLNLETSVLAAGYPAVCAFVNDTLDAEVLTGLYQGGTRCIAMRCAGYNNVDLAKAAELQMPVVRVPAYSPYSVAEHAVGLILTLNRKIHRAHARVQTGNFELNGLLGFDLHGCTVGVLGTGKIGRVFAQILQGFGCRVLGTDPYPHAEFQGDYVPRDQLLRESDILSLHCPLTPETYHMINMETLNRIKPGIMLINTSRGALIDTKAVIEGLKSGKIGYLGLDVYEEEADLFFEDLSDRVIQDDVFARLLTFPNVLITGHQAFFTENALSNIAEVTLQNIADFEQEIELSNQVSRSQS
ncbi:MAG: 2-hydroxyacid dehydrogenase [Chloroflexota bacterium]